MRPEARWVLNENALQLLLRALAPDLEQAALRYEAMRARLIRVLRWERTSDPESLADEAFNRLARRLQEGEPVQDPAAYLRGIVRNLIREDRAAPRELPAIAGASDTAAAPGGVHSEREELERRHAALEQCLQSLDPERRELVLGYYKSDQGERIASRQALAAKLGLELNALRNRALRIRERLEDCLRQRLQPGALPRDVSPGTTTKDRKG